MPYRLQPGESVPGALRRSGREQLENAIGELTDGVKVDVVKAVHDARKALKKERSLLRLGRGTPPAAERRHENDALRDAARGLGAARDADVALDALDGLADRYAGQLPKATFDAVRRRPHGVHPGAGAADGQEPARVAEAVQGSLVPPAVAGRDLPAHDARSRGGCSPSG